MHRIVPTELLFMDVAACRRLDSRTVQMNTAVPGPAVRVSLNVYKSTHNTEV